MNNTTKHAVAERPKLRDYIHMTRVSEEELRFEAGADTVVLKGRSVSEVLPSLLNCLDGVTDIARIKERMPDVEPTVVDDALLLLTKYNLLDERSHKLPESLPPDVASRIENQSNFWLSVRNDRYAMQEALWSATVTVIGIGGVGATAASLLAAAGVGQLTLVDHRKTKASDQLYGVLDSDGGAPKTYRTFRLGEKLASTKTRIRTNEELITTAEQLRAVIEGSNLIILAEDSRMASSARLLNEACLDLEIPWITAHVDHSRGVIGPLIVPRQTACFTCYEYRCKGNNPYFSSGADQSKEDADALRSSALLGPFAGFVGNYLALEAMKQLTGFAYPSTTGRIHAVDFFTMESEIHDVLKLPRCPACGPLRDKPLMKVWDLNPQTKKESPVTE